MSTRVVVACFGDEASTSTIQQLVHTADVIAVAFDLGGVVPLGAMRDAALAAGALRCHALDVREEFARECLIPALHHRAFAAPAEAVTVLAPAFARRELQEIGQLEDAAVIAPETVAISPRPVPRVTIDPARVHIEFANGFPVSINGVEMTLTELMESIETITGEPALHVLDREMNRSREEQWA
jgi:argininosuccinate synthase